MSYGAQNYGGETGIDQTEFDAMSAFSVKSVRLAFIRKVYSILSVQLVITFGIVLAFSLSDGMKGFAKGNPSLVWLGFIVTFMSLIFLMCCGDLRRKFPHNFILLGIFTVAESFMLGITTAHFDTQAVLIAIGVTAIVCAALTAFAFQTKIDFTVYSGAAFVFFLVFFLTGFIMLFVKIPILHTVYAGLGALLFSFFLLIDTQMIVGGTRSMVISPEEYILAVITLYIDIINLFLYILQIVQGSR